MKAEVQRRWYPVRSAFLTRLVLLTAADAARDELDARCIARVLRSLADAPPKEADEFRRALLDCAKDISRTSSVFDTSKTRDALIQALLTLALLGCAVTAAQWLAEWKGAEIQAWITAATIAHAEELP